MNDTTLNAHHGDVHDVPPGNSYEGGKSLAARFRSYLIGLALAAGLTFASFWAAQTDLIYAPGLSAALVTLAIAQMGIHLVFFLHITTGPDNTNNVLALAYGILIVLLVVAGSLWIMADLHDNMTPPAEFMNLHMQH